MRSRLLYRAILSHLAVAVPPAVGLGLLVVEINRNELLFETQRLHLSVAGRVRDTLEARLEGSIGLLQHAERTLDAETISFEERTTLLRALIAAGEIPFFAVYDTGGRLDSLVQNRDEDRPADLDPKVQDDAKKNGRALAALRFDEGRARALLVIPWMLEGKLFGYIATDFDLFELQPTIAHLQREILGLGGEIDVFDMQGRYVLSSNPARIGRPATPDSPFRKVGIETGIASSFRGEAGERRLASVISMPQWGWLISASRETSVAFQSIEQVEQRTFLFSLIAALAAGLMGLFFARRVADPVNHLALMVRRSVRRGFSEAVPVEGTTEVKALAESFNDALVELARYREELRHRSQMQVRLSRYLPPSALHELMSKELAAPDDAVNERVTVLYADIAALADEAPSRQLVEALGAFFTQACRAVEMYGGHIDRYSGDAVIGLFPESTVPAPPLAAYLAAEALVKAASALEGSLQASVGLATGESPILKGDDDPRELTVTGWLVERSAILQNDATAGSILLDEATQDGLSGKSEIVMVGRTGPSQIAERVFQIDIALDHETSTPSS